MRLELEHVTAGYGDTVVLRDVSLTVPSGSVVALVGPNGAGKTTALSVASGLLRPRSGRVLLDDQDRTGAGVDQLARQGLCHVPSGGSVFPELTVRENLALFAAFADDDVLLDRAVQVFPRLGERLDQKVATMSGGERQMLALTRAYSSGASLVLLDEISMGLAPVVGDELFESLRELAGHGTTVLLVEQYVSKALALADFAYLLVHGRVMFCGEAAELAGTDVFAQYLGTGAATT
jgi:branched-chain amino acid transport system ATP-binding protein